MKKNILIAYLLFLTSPALAFENRIDELYTMNPELKPYEILMRAFNESHDRIQIQDIDESRQKCVLSGDRDREAISETVVVRVQARKVVKPGMPAQPGNGPLFPPRPEMPPKTDTKEWLAFKTKNTTQRELQERVDYVSTDFKHNELRTNQVYNNISSSFNSLVFRKNGDLLTFLFLIYCSECSKGKVDLPTWSTYYGYCWNK